MFTANEKAKKQLNFKPRFVKPILDGVKTQTARTSLRSIRENDLIELVSGGKAFALVLVTKIEKRQLKTFDDGDFLREGCTGREDFEKIWEEIHPQKGYKPETRVYVIHFSREWATISLET